MGGTQCLRERRPRVEGPAQGQRVGEEAQDAGGVGVSTAAGRDADGHVVAARQGAQDDGDRGGDDGERGRAGTACDATDRLGAQLHRDGRTVVGASCRTRVIGRDVQRAHTRKPLTPVREPFVVLGRRLGSSHLGEVPVVERGGRGQGAALVEGGVRGGNVVQQAGECPAVGNGVVQGQQEQVDVLGAADDPRTEERAFGEVHRGVTPVRQQFGLVALRGRVRVVGGSVCHGAGPDGVDDLDDLAVLLAQSGPQHLVAAGNLFDRPCQGPGVEPAGDPGAAVQGVGQIRLRVQGAQQPQSLLAGRGGEDDGAVGVGDTRCDRNGRAGLARPVQVGGEVGKGGVFEHEVERDVGAEGLAQPVGEAGGEEGVAAEGEEVVVRADLGDVEEFAPDLGDQFFGRPGRRAEEGAVCAEFGVGERGAVDLAVGEKGELIEGDQGRGDHEVGQPGAGVRRKIGRHSARLVGDNVTNQPQCPEGVRAGDDHRLRHLRVAAQDFLHLAQLDAVATDLHLSVGAAQVIQLAVRAPAHQVPRAVHPAAVRGERVGEVPLRGEGGPGVVAAGDTGSRQVQLTHRAYDHRPQRAIKDVSPRAVHRPADRRPRVTGNGDSMRGVGGVLTRPVEVVHHTDHRMRVQLRNETRRQRLTRKVHRARPRRNRTRRQQLTGDRRHRVHQRHVRIPAWIRDQVQRVVRHQVDRPADRQRGEDLEDRQVEGHRCRSQRVRQLLVREDPAGPGQHRHDLGVLDHHPLRATRRP
ncbi:hypothetical protein SALBM217S_09590 [Streptomyces griseoloalbus]